MNILFLNPSSEFSKGTNRSTIYPPLGLLYIGSQYNNTKNIFKIIDTNSLLNSEKRLEHFFRNEPPQIIGISANVVTTRSAILIAQSIKDRGFKGTLIAGGPMPTVLPDVFLNVFDIVVRNEGEETFKRILDNEPLEKIDGISFKKNGKVVHNKTAEIVNDLNSLSFPDYSLLEPSLNKYRSRSRGFPVAPMITSRGCPYHCIYCNKNIFGYKFRARSPENVIDEIEYLIKEYRIRQIDILDDNFTLDLERAEEILERIIERKFNIFINLQNGICEGRINERIIKKMRQAGVYKVGIGIESGNEKILELNKKDVDLKRVKKVIDLLRGEGIIVYGFFMLGMKGDNMDTMMDTVNFAIEANPHIADFSIAVPFPGTELFQYINEKGRFLHDPLKGYDYGFFSGRAFYETDTTRAEDVERAFSIAYKKFYMRPSKIIDVLATIKSLRELAWTISSSYKIFTRQ
jgi:radical SAM superfamily enzyme YgiQ (UPF0313 family)